MARTAGHCCPSPPAASLPTWERQRHHRGVGPLLAAQVHQRRHILGGRCLPSRAVQRGQALAGVPRRDYQRLGQAGGHAARNRGGRGCSVQQVWRWQRTARMASKGAAGSKLHMCSAWPGMAVICRHVSSDFPLPCSPLPLPAEGQHGEQLGKGRYGCVVAGRRRCRAPQRLPAILCQVRRQRGVVVFVQHLTGGGGGGGGGETEGEQVVYWRS